MNYKGFVTTVMMSVFFAVVATPKYACSEEINFLDKRIQKIELMYVEQVLKSLGNEQATSFEIITRYIGGKLSNANVSLKELEVLKGLVWKYPQVFVNILGEQSKATSNNNVSQLVPILCLIILAADEALVFKSVQIIQKIDVQKRKMILDQALRFVFYPEHVKNFASYLNNFEDYFNSSKMNMIHVAARRNHQSGFVGLVYEQVLDSKGARKELDEYILKIRDNLEREAVSTYQIMADFKKNYYLRLEVIDILRGNPQIDFKEFIKLAQKLSSNQYDDYQDFFYELRDIVECTNYLPEADCENRKDQIIQNLLNNHQRQNSFRPNLYGLNSIFYNEYKGKVFEFVEKTVDHFDILSIHQQAYSVYLMALKIGDDSLKEIAKESITTSILGENASFNSISPEIFEQPIFIDDDGMVPDRIGILKNRYTQQGKSYYQIQNKVDTVENRFAYFINQIASSLEIKFLMTVEDIQEVGLNDDMINKSKQIAKLLTQLWEGIIIDNPQVVEEAKRILNRPESDFGRISAEAFLKANKGPEELSTYLREIENKDWINYLEKLEKLDVSKKPVPTHPSYEERTVNQALYSQKIKTYQEYHQARERVKVITRSLVYYNNRFEIKKWLKDFFLNSKHIECENDIELDIVMAALLSFDDDLQYIASQYVLSKMNRSLPKPAWEQNLLGGLRVYLHQSDQHKMKMNVSKLVSLFTTQCDEQFIKKSLLPEYMQEINHDMKKILEKIISGCLSNEQIDLIISQIVEKQLIGNIPDIESMVEGITRVDHAWSGLSKSELNALENFFSFASYDMPQVRSRLLQIITYLSIYHEESLVGKILFLGLKKKGEFDEFVTELILQRMKGKDELFNRTLGRIYKTDKSKEEYFFLKILYGVRYGLLSKEEILSLLLKLDFNYRLIQEAVEFEARYHSSYTPSLEVEIAQKYIREKKGADYLNQILLNNDIRNLYMVVNGGYSPTSNDEYQEIAIESFDRFLFHQEAVVLNAGGPQTLYAVVDDLGTQQRDQDGMIQVKESTYSKTTLKAIFKNIDRVVDDFVKKKPKKVSFAFIDHGGPEGMALWGERMDMNKQRSYLDKFDENTIVQSFFSACHAGANLVFPHRVYPFQSANMFEFLEFHYPYNRCALGISMHDEVSYSYTVAKTSAADSKWSQIFKAFPKLTLATFQRILYGSGIHDGLSDGKVSSTPILTSDYFVDDIAKIICLEKLQKPENTDVMNSPFFVEIIPKTLEENLQITSARLINEIVALSCGDEHRQKMDKFTKEYKEFELWYDKFQSLLNSVTVKYLKEIRPEAFMEYTKYLKEIEGLKAKLLTNEITGEEKDKLFYLRDNPPLSYSKIKSSIEKGYQFNKQFNEIFINIIESKENEVVLENGQLFGPSAMYIENKDKIYSSTITFKKEELEYLRKKFSNCLINKSSCVNGNLINDLLDDCYQKGRTAQVERQKYYQKYRSTLRKLVEELLDDPYLLSIRRRYESIHHCENIPFN
ncbi:MAG: hypothetical protein A2381_11475 [Bdellovibrionales bacterium RIFOXYB1_FULL_37_110]|nr:MAG: hypothetical protein A2417_11780 [Bdellovibrionales bacterium RIFOXYC1_FULL_37_79]OFZ57313.1 MAG: hypothetical protein A2381_11475 [Bdellovibrionales bacterium RIFOXYB1_FULL_37_110]OFZ62209.1 MAG: hypothetical protein A2577_14025 [Bdellovibrionales bacterium RIFOXYD1_FULL_36_51]